MKLGHEALTSDVMVVLRTHFVANIILRFV